MQKIFMILFIPALIAAATSPQATPPQSKLEFPASGFSIAPYIDAAPSNVSISPLIMSAAPTNGFATNVNIVIQPFAKPMSDFITLSKTQFAQVGAAILSEKTPNANEWTCEYQAPLSGRSLHFYARAISANNHVYLVTGTSTEAQWPSASEKLKDCVNSLEVKNITANTKNSSDK